MYDDPFSTSTGLVNIQDHLGCLLLVTPTEKIVKKTKFKPEGQETVKADFVVLDGPEAGLVEESVLIFNAPLVGALERRIGRQQPQLLGRLENAPNPNNPKQPMWVFGNPTEEDKALARRWIAEQAAGATTEENDPYAL